MNFHEGDPITSILIRNEITGIPGTLIALLVIAPPGYPLSWLPEPKMRCPLLLPWVRSISAHIAKLSSFWVSPCAPVPMLYLGFIFGFQSQSMGFSPATITSLFVRHLPGVPPPQPSGFPFTPAFLPQSPAYPMFVWGVCWILWETSSAMVWNVEKFIRKDLWNQHPLKAEEDAR